MVVPDDGLGPGFIAQTFQRSAPALIRHVTRYSGEGLGLSSDRFEEPRLAVRKLDAQSRFPTFCDVCRFDFAALYTLQHGLTGDAKRAGGLLHGDESVARRGGKACF